MLHNIKAAQLQDRVDRLWLYLDSPPKCRFRLRRPAGGNISQRQAGVVVRLRGIESDSRLKFPNRQGPSLHRRVLFTQNRVCIGHCGIGGDDFFGRSLRIVILAAANQQCCELKLRFRIVGVEFDRRQQLLVRLLIRFQLQVCAGKPVVGVGGAGVDLDCVTELDNGFLVFTRFRILRSTSKKGGFLCRGISGACSQNQDRQDEAYTILPWELDS